MYVDDRLATDIRTAQSRATLGHNVRNDDHSFILKNLRRRRWTYLFNARRSHLLTGSKTRNYFISHNIPVKHGRTAKKRRTNSAHLMMPFLRGLAIYGYPLFAPIILQGRFRTCATRGACLLTQAYAPIISKTTGNVICPKRQSWSSPMPIALAILYGAFFN
jgi:hypothetical protein